jgi:hypothetical protein
MGRTNRETKVEFIFMYRIGKTRVLLRSGRLSTPTTTTHGESLSQFPAANGAKERVTKKNSHRIFFFPTHGPRLKN